VALATGDADVMAGWATEQGLSDASYDELVKSQRLRDLIGEHGGRLNAELNRWDTMMKWALLEHDLTWRGSADTVTEGQARGGGRAEQRAPRLLLCVVLYEVLYDQRPVE
jgi:long-chain acyl-CoA synthetase